MEDGLHRSAVSCEPRISISVDGIECPPNVLSPLNARRSVSSSACVPIAHPNAHSPLVASVCTEPAPAAWSRALSVPSIPAAVPSPAPRQPQPASNLGGNILPTVEPDSDTHHDVRFITPDTLAALIDGQFEEHFDEYRIIDCRFPYEFHGGHIQGALNVWHMEGTEAKFLSHPVVDISNGGRICLIFHCEFSSFRAPAQFKHLRMLDRFITLSHSDKGVLVFPEMYVLQGGYCRFFQERPELCTPNSYLRMKDPEYDQECNRHETILRCSRENANQAKWQTYSAVQTLRHTVDRAGIAGLRELNLQPGSPVPHVAGQAMTPKTPAGQLLPPLD